MLPKNATVSFLKTIHLPTNDHKAFCYVALIAATDAENCTGFHAQLFDHVNTNTH